MGAATSHSSIEVAALYVDPHGVYSGLDGVDLWDEARDARLYAGPFPVVAHPPCNKWSPLAFINQARIPGYRVGDDAGCFRAALDAVRRFGGVLEHPAHSIAWSEYELPRPTWRGWTCDLFGRWVCEVDQAAYGHRARKRTWLLYSGEHPPAALDWSSPTVEATVSGFHHHARGDYHASERTRVRPREASATPPAFAEALVSLARLAR